MSVQDVDLEMTATAPANSTSSVHKNTTENHQRCAKLRICCHSCTKPVRTKYNPLPDDAELMDRFKYWFMCPPHGKLARYMMFVLMFFIAWVVVISITGAAGMPGGNFFSLVILFFGCVVGGYLVVFIRLPPLLGKLFYNDLIRTCDVRFKIVFVLIFA